MSAESWELVAVVIYVGFGIMGATIHIFQCLDRRNIYFETREAPIGIIGVIGGPVFPLILGTCWFVRQRAGILLTWSSVAAIVAILGIAVHVGAIQIGF